MRPPAIVHFEIIFLISLPLSALMSFIMYEQDFMGMMSDSEIAIDSVVSLIYVAMALWASRFGSNFARWIFTIVTIIGIIGFALTIDEIRRMGPVMVFSTPAYIVLQTAMIIFLFTSDARSWFRK